MLTRDTAAYAGDVNPIQSYTALSKHRVESKHRKIAVAEYAARFGWTPAAIHQRIRAGILYGEKVDEQWYVLQEELGVASAPVEAEDARTADTEMVLTHEGELIAAVVGSLLVGAALILTAFFTELLTGLVMGLFGALYLFSLLRLRTVTVTAGGLRLGEEMCPWVEVESIVAWRRRRSLLWPSPVIVTVRRKRGGTVTTHLSSQQWQDEMEMVEQRWRQAEPHIGLAVAHNGAKLELRRRCDAGITQHCR